MVQGRMGANMTANRTDKKAVHLSEIAYWPLEDMPPMKPSEAGPTMIAFSTATGRKGFFAEEYGHGLPKDVIDAQRIMNGVHDDLLYATALGMLCWKRPPWYKRWWWAVKRFCKSLRIGLSQ